MEEKLLLIRNEMGKLKNESFQILKILETLHDSVKTLRTKTVDLSPVESQPVLRSAHRTARKSVQTNYIRTLNSNRNTQCVNLSLRATDANKEKKENIRSSYYYDTRSARNSNISHGINQTSHTDLAYERKLDSFSSLFDYRYNEKMSKKNSQFSNATTNSYHQEAHTFQPIRHKFYNEIFYL